MIRKTGRHDIFTAMMCKLRIRHFNKLEAVHAINHIKDATNITLHILKVSRHIDLCVIPKNNSFM